MSHNPTPDNTAPIGRTETITDGTGIMSGTPLNPVISASVAKTAMGLDNVFTKTISSLTLSLVGTGATGTQISATKDSSVKCTVATSTTASIGGPSTSVVTMKICATNSSTEGDWTTVSIVRNDQTITLSIVLNSIQVINGQCSSDVPAGWYVKLVNTGTGTHTETYISGQKTIYG